MYVSVEITHLKQKGCLLSYIGNFFFYGNIGNFFDTISI